MPQHDHAARLNDLVDDLDKLTRAFADSDGNNELRGFFRRPGYTTPAEMLFTEGMLRSISDQVRIAQTTRDLLLQAAREVGEKR